MADHKNKNNAIGNFCIYQILIKQRLFKYGKADTDRITKSSGDPTRIHQQKRILSKIYGDGTARHQIISDLLNVSTEDAKNEEKSILQQYYELTGEVPEGNKNSFKP
jgi:URI fold toxin 2